MMGATSRNAVFACWLMRQFPKAQRVLCVADGKGALSRELAKRQKTVTVVEAKPRFGGLGHKRIEYKRGWFTRDTSVGDAELIVGMHPDEATAEIILAARANGLPWAVVPCCIKGDGAKACKTFGGWLRRLVSLDPPAQQTVLKFSGKNVVLWRRRRRDD